MTAITKKSFKRCIFQLVLASLFAFFIFYIPNIYLGELPIALYTAYFTKELINFAIPIIASVAVTLAALDMKKSRALIYSLCFAAVPLPYTIPYYYYEYVTDYYNSLEALLLAFLMSLLLAAAFTLEVFIYHLIIKATIKRGGDTAPIHTPTFDFDSSATLGVFYAVLLKYIYETAFELYSVVSYFIEYAGSYRTGEIVYIAVSLLLLVLFGILTHTAACKVKNKLTTLN